MKFFERIKLVDNKLRAWIRSRGAVGIFTVVVVVTVVLSSGIGVTVAATGGFRPQQSPTPVPSSELPQPTASQTYDYGQITQAVTEGVADAGVNQIRPSPGFNVILGNNGVQFSYVGPCSEIGGLTVRTNTGAVITVSPGCTYINPKGLSGTTGYNWSGNFDHYCRTINPTSGAAFYGGATAIRGEIFNLVTEWIPIPQQYRVCPITQAPVPPAQPAPVPPAPPAPTAPAPSAVSSSTPSAAP